MEVLDPSFKYMLIEFSCLAPEMHIAPLPLPRNANLLFNHCFSVDQVSDVSRAPLAVCAGLAKI